MRLKNFILALVAMLWSFSFSVAAQTDVVVVYNEAQLREALSADGVHGARLQRSAAQQSSEPNVIKFGSDITLDAPIEISFEANSVLELDGYALVGASIEGTNKHLYAFYNAGKLKIQDSKGGGYIDCGVINGLDLSNEKYPDAELSIASGRIVCHDDEGAAVMNYGKTFITGGSFEGSVNALKNFQGSMSVAGDAVITGGIDGDGINISTDVKYAVAKIGDNVYTTFGEALAAANAMTGDVTMQIFGEVEFTDGMELNGSYTSINFVGKSDKAKMTVNQTAGGDYLTAHGKTVNFTDLTLAKANPAWSGNSGHMGNYFSIQGGTVTYTNCTFLNGACTSGGTATYTGCTFQNASEYGLWVYDDALVTVNGGTVNSVKGIKVYSEDETSVTSTLTVKNAIFTENVTKKPAVAIGYAESITLIGNTYNNTKGVLELDSGSDADCEGITFVAQDKDGNDISSTITATDRSNNDVACGVLVDGKIYTTVTEAAKETEAGDIVTLLYSSTETVALPIGAVLNKNGKTADGVTVTQAIAKIGDVEYATLADAIAAVKNGETITLVAGVEEDVTVVQAPDVAFTIDGNDNTFKGTITVDGKSAAYATAAVTVKNIKFLADGITKDACINLGGNNNIRYTSNVTVDGCTFTGTAKDKVGVKSYTDGCKNVKIINSTATGMHSLAQLYPTAGVVIADNTITDSKNGVSVRSSSNVTISGVTMNVEGYGVRADASVATNATITDCNISAFIPVVVRNASADYNLTFAGDNTMDAGNEDGLWCAIGTSEYEENGTMPTAATGKVKVTLNEEDTDLDIAGVYGNFGVASIGNVNYMTFAAALDAVKNGETIILAENATGDEKSKEIEFTKAINFTITGKAPQYALPVVTFQNATVNIVNAQFQTPELDARQNATINVDNSTIVDAGGNSIVKSYYNGKINIINNSTVYAMQVTTMGYIYVAGSSTLNATWQTNVYGNGMITLSGGATFNTAALHLTAQDYNDRDNTDADRVGKPATIVVDGANLTIGKVLSAGGADYSYNSSKGVNVGTVDGKSAILDIKNGGAVNIYMANGETANFGAGATVNVEASTLKVLCRAADGVATLANAGTVNVSGESNLDIKNFSGNAIAVTDATLNDLQFGGRINAFGTNNISGTSKIGDILSLGYETNPTGQVVVNITGNFNGTNVIVYTNNSVDNLLNVGAADGERTTAYFGQLGGFADVNINNADVTYHYAFIRNGFKVTNSALAIAGGVNTYISGNAEVVLDGSTWNLPGFANIGSYGGYNYGNADVTLKNGSSMTATDLGIELEEGKEVKLTIEDNSKLTATNLSNQGSIVLESKEATITANSGVSNITTPIEDHKIGYVDGTYKVISKQYVAYIGEQGYESLAEALTAAADGETVSLSWGEGNPAIAMNGTVCGNKTVTITGTANVDWSKGWFFVGRGGEGDGKVIFYNAHLTSVSNSTALGINVSGRKKGSTDTYNGTVEFKNSTVVLDYLIQKNVMTLDNSTLTVKNGCSLTGRLANETENGELATSTTTLNNGSKLVVIGQNGMNLGYEGYGVLNINANSTFEATQGYGVAANGTMNVNGGTVRIAGTLANAGTVYVTDEANLDAKVTGEGWFYMNGVNLDADTKLNGAKVAFINGENTVKGSTFKDGWFSVGIGQNAAAATAAEFAQANGITLGDVTVNVSEKATIYTSTDAACSGWVGSAYSADKDAHKYILNITNSLARFGYMHVSKDGELNATGHTTNKYEYAGNAVDFYAGTFINNGNVTLNGVDAWAMYSKISVDHADAVLSIENGTKYMSNCTTGDVNANTFLYYKAGTVNVDETSSVNIEKATTFVDGAVLNIAGNVTAKGAINGNGAINFTSDVATLTTATTGLTIGYNLNADKKVVYTEGAYKVAEKLYVAQIGDAKYETLQEAIENVADNGTVTLLSDVTVTEAAYGQNALNHARAINFTLDLNGKKLSADTGNSVFRFNIADSGATSDVTVTVKNGTVVSGANTWCTLMASGASADAKAVMNLEDLTIENYKGGDFAVKAWANGVVNARNVVINASYGGGFYALGGEIVLDDCTVEQKGLWTAPYNSMTIGVSHGGKMTVNSGTYSALPVAAADGNNQGTSHGSWCGGVMSSGGTLVINGGNFSNGNFGGTASNPRELFIVGADADYGDNVAARLEINGGTFNSIGALIHCETIWGSENDAANTYMPAMDVVITDGNFTGVAGKTIGGCDPISTGNPVEVVISGGTYSANHAIDNSYLADAYTIVDNGNGTYTVATAAVKIGDTYYASLEAGLKALTDGATLTFIEDITVTEAWDERYTGGRISANNVTIDGNGKTVTFACDIQDGANYCAPFRIEGASATFKNLTIDMSQATNSRFNRLRAISSNATDLTVTNCKFIGSETITNSCAIIFGEGSQNIPGTDINISECTFKNWRYGVTDNENGKDVGNVTVTGNIFENSSVQISASSNVVFSNNSLADGGVNITSYTNVEGVSVMAINNTLDADEDNKITTNPARHTIAGEGFSTPVAKTAGKYHVSIQDAVEYGAEIELISKNRYIYLDEAVEIGNSSVTLILNNRVIRATEDAKMTGGIFRLLDGADLTITGEGEINYNGNANVYTAVGVLGNATLTVESGKLVGYYYGIAGNGMKDGSTITINGGEISSVESTGSGIYHPQNGTLNVYGGTVAGATGIYFKSGALNITDGTIMGTGAKVEYAYNGNGSDATGDALVIENVAAGNYEAVTSVSITGGTFVSHNAAPIASYGDNKLVEFIGEGCNAQFNNTNIDESLLVVGYQLSTAANANGCYSVVLTMKRESMTIDVSDYADKYENTEEITVGTLTFKRTLNEGVWNAFFVPFEVPLSALMENYDVAYLNDANFYDRDDNGSIEEIAVQYVKFTEAQKDKKLHANHPYRIRPKNAEAANMNLELTDVVLQTTKKENRKVLKCSGVYTNIEWHGLYERSDASDFLDGNNVNDMCYAENKSGIWQNIGTYSVAPFRVMMVMTNSDEMPYTFDEEALANVRTITLGEDEFDTTGIIDIDSDSENSDVIFDLQGRRVLKPVKGNLYIINGKKVVY